MGEVYFPDDESRRVGTAEFDLIHVVRKRPGITQAEISKILGADKGAVAKQTANLEAKGYFAEK